MFKKYVITYLNLLNICQTVQDRDIGQAVRKEEKRYLPWGWKPAVIAGVIAFAVVYTGLTGAKSLSKPEETGAKKERRNYVERVIYRTSKYAGQAKEFVGGLISDDSGYTAKE